MFNVQRHIDLHLPRGWNQCTTDELELIASVITLQSFVANRYHPFLWEDVKVRIVFALNRMEMLNAPANDEPIESAVFEVCRRVERPDGRLRRWWFEHTHRKQIRKEEEPFNISAGQMASLVDMLSWLDDEKAEPLLKVPYPEIKISGTKRMFNGQCSMFNGPQPLLDGYTWKEYRLLQDWMQEYIRAANSLARSRTDEYKIKNQKVVDEARCQILSILFKKQEDSDGAENSQLFIDFSPIKWQVMLFWWSGLMRYLQKKYPRCFNSQKVSSRSNPLELYVRSTATIEKYVGLNEQEVNNESFHVVLQHLEDMAKESEEIERISRKNKK